MYVYNHVTAVTQIKPQNISAPMRLPLTPSQSVLFPPRQTLFSFINIDEFCKSVLEHCVNGITQYILFSIRFLSFNIMYVRFIHGLHFIAVQYSIIRLYHNLFICYIVDGHLGGFQFLFIMNNSAMTILECHLVGIRTHISWIYNKEFNLLIFFCPYKKSVFAQKS